MRWMHHQARPHEVIPRNLAWDGNVNERKPQTHYNVAIHGHRHLRLQRAGE